ERPAVTRRSRSHRSLRSSQRAIQYAVGLVGSEPGLGEPLDDAVLVLEQPAGLTPADIALRCPGPDPVVECRIDSLAAPLREDAQQQDACAGDLLATQLPDHR